MICARLPKAPEFPAEALCQGAFWPISPWSARIAQNMGSPNIPTLPLPLCSRKAAVPAGIPCSVPKVPAIPVFRTHPTASPTRLIPSSAASRNLPDASGRRNASPPVTLRASAWLFRGTISAMDTSPGRLNGEVIRRQTQRNFHRWKPKRQDAPGTATSIMSATSCGIIKKCSLRKTGILSGLCRGIPAYRPGTGHGPIPLPERPVRSIPALISRLQRERRFLHPQTGK